MLSWLYRQASTDSQAGALEASMHWYDTFWMMGICLEYFPDIDASAAVAEEILEYLQVESLSDLDRCTNCEPLPHLANQCMSLMKQIVRHCGEVPEGLLARLKDVAEHVIWRCGLNPIDSRLVYWTEHLQLSVESHNAKFAKFVGSKLSQLGIDF